MGHPAAKVAEIVSRAAATAAQARGAPADLVAKLANDARDTVDLDNSGDWDVQQWNNRVYTEFDKKKAEDKSLKEFVDQRNINKEEAEGKAEAGELETEGSTAQGAAGAEAAAASAGSAA